MKKNLVIVFAIITTCVLPSNVSAALTDNLNAYYKFDESGGNAADSVGSNILTNNAAATYSAGKIKNGTLLTRTSTQYFSHADTNAFDITTDFSISAWVKITNAPTSGQHFNILSKDDNGSTGRSYGLDYNNTGGTKQFSLYIFPNGYSYPGYWNGTFNYDLGTGVFHHVVVILTLANSNSTKAELYIDGVSQGNFTLSDGTGATSIQNGAADFRVGLDWGSGAYMDGLIDELGIWSRTLSSSEVAQLYNNGLGLEYPFGTPPPPAINGSGTINRLAKFIAGSSIGDSLFSDDGLNTTLTSGNFFLQIGSLIDSVTNGVLNFGTTQATTINIGRFGQNMIINSKVGISTSTPSATLDVNGDLSANLINITANGLGIDTLTSGVFSIGSTTASAVKIGRAGITATVPGTIAFGTVGTVSNCNSSASPAVCGSAPAGSVAMATGGSTLVVNTTAVTANSQIMITEDSSLGSRLGITCNTGTGRNYSVSARTAGTSFTIKSSANPVTNKACLSYWILN